MRGEVKDAIVKFMANIANMGFYDIPNKAICAFEKWSGLQIAVHDLGRDLIPFLDSERFNHRNPFCDLMKVTGFNPACYRFEVDRLRPYLRVHPEGCAKVCHAGILEWSAPVMVDGRLSVVLFAGLRLRKRGIPVDLVDPEPTRAFELWPVGVAKPARVSAEQSQLYLEGLRQLAARLQCWIKDRARIGESIGLADAGTRREQRQRIVQRFIAERFLEPITLADLSEELHLSRSRTAHLVAEACGRTFGEQLKEIRLRHAAGLVRQTDCSIAEAAMDSGFGDVSNFHKAFKKQYGMTPLQYRKSSRI